MPTIIKDGRGTGNAAKVQSDGKLAVLSETFPMQARSSLVEHGAYQVYSGIQTVVTAGQYGILALGNTSTTGGHLIVTYIRCGVNRIETQEMLIEIKSDGTWVDGTPLTPHNMYIGSSVLPASRAHTNATPIGSTTFDARYLQGPNCAKWSKEGSLIIPPGETLSVSVTTSTDNASVYARISYIELSAQGLEDRF